MQVIKISKSNFVMARSLNSFWLHCRESANGSVCRIVLESRSGKEYSLNVENQEHGEREIERLALWMDGPHGMFQIRPWVEQADGATVEEDLVVEKSHSEKLLSGKEAENA
jgi:hypothetical protein